MSKRAAGRVDISDRKPSICVNRECRLRKAGCRGFEGCPGYRGKGRRDRKPPPETR